MTLSPPLTEHSYQAIDRILYFKTFHNQLIDLDKYFDSFFRCYVLPADYNSLEDRGLIENIKALHQFLKRNQKQVTLFGVFKSGKSTFLNAVIGKKILPCRANRATGVVTRINYASKPSAYIIRSQPTVHYREAVQLDELAKYILLDISETVAKVTEKIDSVEIELPLTLLENNFCLADTPGLLDNQYLTDRTYEEIEKSDLSIIVLRADKLLSQPERDAVKQINNLLNGNIIFVLNRLGLIEPEDQEDVLNWTRNSLNGLGNRFVGKPQIFATDALAVLTARNEQKREENTDKYLHNLKNFKIWLKSLLTSPAAERVIILSRLGILNNQLEKARDYFQIRLFQLQEEVASLEQAAQDNFNRQQAEFNQTISEAKLKLIHIKAELLQIVEDLVTNFVQQATSILDEDDPHWANRVQNEWNLVCKYYQTSIEQKTTSALTNIKTQFPKFNSTDFEKITQVTLPKDAATKVTGLIGGSFALGASRMIAQVLFGNNLKKENLETIKYAVSQSRDRLIIESDKYLKQTKRVLENYCITNQPKLETASQLINARKALASYINLLNCLDSFQNAIRNIKEEVLSWNLEFSNLWEDFIKQFKNVFYKEYIRQRKKISSKKALNHMLEPVLQSQLKKWNNKNDYYGIWLDSLAKCHPNLGSEFEAILKVIRVEKSLEVPKKFDKLEIVIGIVTIVGTVLILFWGQSFKNLNVTNINLNQVATGIGIVVFGSYWVKNIRDERLEKQTINLTEQITQELDSYGDQLRKIVIKAD